MSIKISSILFVFVCAFSSCFATEKEGARRNEKAKPQKAALQTVAPKKICLYWWQPCNETRNFGDELSQVLVQRILNPCVLVPREQVSRRLLAVGSILQFAQDGDVIWGSGINGKHMNKEDYHFHTLDVRAVRGPLTRQFLLKMGIPCPEVYGDPVLLFPHFFPELKAVARNEYIIIPHISEIHMFAGRPNVVLPTEHWKLVVQKILESKFVISSSLHGIVLAEAYGIPARLLRVTENEPLFKYQDYYLGTGRSSFHYAKSVEEALVLGGEPLPKLNLYPLLRAFPFDL